MKTIKGKDSVFESTLKGVSKLRPTNPKLAREGIEEMRGVQDK